MRRYLANSTVPGGYYWSPSKWTCEAVSNDQGTLTGDEGESFLRIPSPIVVPVVLLLSFLFVVFLPVIGFAMLAYVPIKKLVG